MGARNYMAQPLARLRDHPQYVVLITHDIPLNRATIESSKSRPV
jgi:hypothetical protein